MKTMKAKTETYLLSELDRLDPVTVYVTNYEPGKGKIVIECYGKCWTHYWGGMSGKLLQEFFIGGDNEYLLGKLLVTTTETDFEKIESLAKDRGFDICATSDVELAMLAKEMYECFGPEWFLNLPSCETSESRYLGRIIDAIKLAFNEECLAKQGYQ